MTMRADRCSARHIAKRLGRSPGSITRELKCIDGVLVYDANLAHQPSEARRVVPRRASKLKPGCALFQVVVRHLKWLWSPEQIAGVLKVTWPGPRKKPCDTTPFTRPSRPSQGAQKGTNWSTACVTTTRYAGRAHVVRIVATRLQAWPAFTRAQLKIENREVPGQWEGDLIEGAGNPSSVGTLVERSSQ